MSEQAEIIRDEEKMIGEKILALLSGYSVVEIGSILGYSYTKIIKILLNIKELEQVDAAQYFNHLLEELIINMELLLGRHLHFTFVIGEPIDRKN